jgi:hypothetical protein
MKDFFLKDKPEKFMSDLKDFFNAQDKWMRNQIEKNVPRAFFITASQM